VALNSRICAGMKRKQKKNAAIPHGVNAEAKVLASIRWVHEKEVLAVCAPVFFAGKRMREYSLKGWQMRVPNR
jgi:hypothetical protein